MYAPLYHSWETAWYHSPHFLDEKLRCRACPDRAGNRGPIWSMFICDIFPTLSCYAALPRPASGFVGWVAPLWTSFAWSLSSQNLEEGKAAWLSMGNHTTCLWERTTCNSHTPGAVSIQKHTWHEMARASFLHSRKNPPKNTQCGLFSA